MRFSSRFARSALAVAASSLALTPPILVLPAEAAPRIKDVADFEGVRENQLVGYGLVVGLAGTGDSLRNSPFTRQSLAAMLERLGVNATNGNLNTRNVARRDGDGEPAALLLARLADRCDGLGIGRCAQLGGRAIAGDAADGRGPAGLCGGARPARNRRLCR